MKFTSRRYWIASAISLMAAANVGYAQESYPQKQISIVVAYPAGGDADALARLLADKLTTRLGQPVIVENRPGASGTIGSSYVSRARADGYTLLMAASTMPIAQFVVKTAGATHYDPLQGFTPIVQTGDQSLALVVGPGTSVKTPKELVAEAKRLGEFGYATPGSGSPMHIAGELFTRSADVKLNHVPYKGVAPAINDVLGGHVPASFITLGPVIPYLSTGKLKPLAIADSQRSSLLPEVPTLLELGYKDVEVRAWSGLFGPPNLPANVVQILNTQVNEILKEKDSVTKMAAIGMVPVGGSPQKLAQTNAADFEKFGKLIKALNIQAN